MAEQSSAGEMSRRGFLVVGGMIAATVVPAAGNGRNHKSHLSTLGEAKTRVAAKPDPFELAEASVAELADGQASGRWTSVDLVRLYNERIDALDQRGPTLRHMLDRNPDAEAIADQLDRERKAGKLRGPLHGVPVVIKDNIDTGDRMTTTAGSLALAGSHALRDAFLAERLRAAGAVILGKTNLTEWANFRSTRASSGWSSRGGQGKNPVCLDRTPCGSSSGTGGAIAACYAAVGIGTETDGSVTCPSATVGLVGLKPTVGLVSRSGIIPISATQDTAGPMTRTVADAAILLSAITGVDPRDTATAASRAHAGTDYIRFLDRAALKGKRIGVTRARFTGYHPDTDRIFGDALDVLRQLGAIIVDPANLPHAGEYDEAEYEVLLYEFKAGLNAYLATLGPGAPIRTLEEAIAFNDRNAARVMPYFGQEIFHLAQAKGPLTTPAYRAALAKCRRLSRELGIDAVMARHRLDAMVAPTGNPAWPIDLVNGDHFTGSVTTPAAVAGYPHITVPMGASFGLPVGLSFFGKAWSEGALIGMAYAYEQATMHRKGPEFLSSLEVGAPL